MVDISFGWVPMAEAECTFASEAEIWRLASHLPIEACHYMCRRLRKAATNAEATSPSMTLSMPSSLASTCAGYLREVKPSVPWFMNVGIGCIAGSHRSNRLDWNLGHLSSKCSGQTLACLQDVTGGSVLLHGDTGPNRHRVSRKEAKKGA